MKKFRLLILSMLLAFTLPYTYGGCSGGGGGGGDSTLTYSGLTTPAVIDQGNAEEISGSALGAGLVSDGLMGLASVQASATHRTANFRSVKIPLILNDCLESINLPSSSANSSRAVYSDSDTINGNCGGTMSYYIRVDDVQGSFEGRFTFSNYCNDDTTLNGGASFSGEIDVASGAFLEATFTFNNLTGDGLTIDGQIIIDFSTSPNELIFNGYTQDPVSEKVCRVRDYIITIDDYAGFVEVEITGTFYFPDYGYVTLTTPDPLVIYDGDEWPSSGTLIVTGSSNTKARVTAIDELTCTVEADVDGDDAYEWDSGIVNWEDL